MPLQMPVPIPLPLPFTQHPTVTHCTDSTRHASQPLRASKRATYDAHTQHRFEFCYFVAMYTCMLFSDGGSHRQSARHHCSDAALDITALPDGLTSTSATLECNTPSMSETATLLLISVGTTLLSTDRFPLPVSGDEALCHL